MAEVPVPSERIFSQAESGRPKTEVLDMLQERHLGTQYHFIEDKLGTLEKVSLGASQLLPLRKSEIVSTSRPVLPSSKVKTQVCM